MNKNATNALVTQYTPPISSFWGERPGVELASRLGEGNGAVSKAGKGVFYIRRKMFSYIYR